MNKPDGFLSRPAPIADEPRNAFRLVCDSGVWAVRPVVTLDRPNGGWYRSGFVYRLVGGTADGDDLFLSHADAVVARDARNAKTGGWNGKR